MKQLSRAAHSGMRLGILTAINLLLLISAAIWQLPMSFVTLICAWLLADGALGGLLLAAMFLSLVALFYTIMAAALLDNWKLWLLSLPFQGLIYGAVLFLLDTGADPSITTLAVFLFIAQGLGFLLRLFIRARKRRMGGTNASAKTSLPKMQVQ
ncbi:MAG: hypothetical protein IJX47_07825 [Clostridia bacterium]|nr:hypothetical protein [Clostridia bacterium]